MNTKDKPTYVLMATVCGLAITAQADIVSNEFGRSQNKNPETTSYNTDRLSTDTNSFENCPVLVAPEIEGKWKSSEYGTVPKNNDLVSYKTEEESFDLLDKEEQEDFVDTDVYVRMQPISKKKVNLKITGKRYPSPRPVL